MGGETGRSFHQQPGGVIYPFSLQQTGLATGLLLAAAHAYALARPEATKRWLAAFPRSRAAGLVLLAAAALWSLGLVARMDLGEFAGLRNALLVGIVAAAGLSAVFMTEFLAVRALGMVLLLAAEPLLSSAFLRPETSRLLLVTLAYAWIFAGLFWVGMPYLLRDQIQWVLAHPNRFAWLARLGATYGAVLVICSLILW